MDSFSPIRRVYYAYLSRMYAVMYAISRRTFLGLRLITLVRWLPVIVLLIGWMREWSFPILGGLLALIVWINFSLWRARRDNYTRFVPLASPSVDGAALTPLPINQKVDLRATGLFSVSGRENSLLLHPAQFWRVPLGDLIVMVQEGPGKYLYQFFNGASLQDVRQGLLLFGAHPVESLAVSFLARWGPDYTRFGQSDETGGDDLPPPKRVTIFLSSEDEETRARIRETIVTAARQVRSGEAK